MSASFNGDNLRGMRYFIEYARHLGVLDPQENPASPLHRAPNDILTKIASYLDAASTNNVVRSAKSFKDRAIQLYKGNETAAEKLLGYCDHNVSQLSEGERTQLSQLGHTVKTVDLSQYELDWRRVKSKKYTRCVNKMQAVLRYTPRVEHLSAPLFNHAATQAALQFGLPLRTLTLTGQADSNPDKKVVPATAAQLTQLLESYPRLAALNFNKYDLPEGVLSCLQQLKQLTSLSFHSCYGVPRDVIERVAEHRPQLKTLSLDCDCDDDYEQTAADSETLFALSKLPCLQSLELRYFFIRDTHMLQFGKLPDLKELKLYDLKHISAAGLNGLCALNLTTLELDDLDCRLTAEAFDALLQSQKELKNCKLCFSPDFAGNNPEVSALALRGLAHCQQLTTLELSRVKHFDGEAASWMGTLRALTEIELGYCQDIGKATLEAFSKMPLLHSLKIVYSNCIDMQGVAADWALPQLRVLELYDSFSNAAAACRMLQGCQRLEKLMIRDYPTNEAAAPVINDASLQHIGALRELRELEILMKDALTEKMLERLFPLKQLRKLTITCKDGKKLDVSELRRQLPHTKITINGDDSDSDVSSSSSDSDSDSDVSSTSSSSSSDSDSGTDSSSDEE